jgi:hypothetical protein
VVGIFDRTPDSVPTSSILILAFSVWRRSKCASEYLASAIQGSPRNTKSRPSIGRLCVGAVTPLASNQVSALLIQPPEADLKQ